MWCPNCFYGSDRTTFKMEKCPQCGHRFSAGKALDKNPFVAEAKGFSKKKTSDAANRDTFDYRQ